MLVGSDGRYGISIGWRIGKVASPSAKHMFDLTAIFWIVRAFPATRAGAAGAGYPGSTTSLASGGEMGGLGFHSHVSHLLRPQRPWLSRSRSARSRRRGLSKGQTHHPFILVRILALVASLLDQSVVAHSSTISFNSRARHLLRHQHFFLDFSCLGVVRKNWKSKKNIDDIEEIRSK